MRNDSSMRIWSLALVCALTGVAQAQLSSPEYSWANRWGHTGALVEDGRAVAISRDLDLNVDRIYVAGTFTSQITIGSTTLTSAGGIDIYVARLATNGTVLAVAQYGTTSDDEVFDMAVTSASTQHPSIGQGVYLCGKSGSMALVLKWPIGLTGAPTVMNQEFLYGEARGIAISGSTLFVTGRSGGIISYNNPGPGELDMTFNGSGGGVYLLRLNYLLEATHAVIPFTGGASCGNDIAIYNGRAYITGWYSQVVRFNSNSASLLPPVQGTRDIFTCSAIIPTTSGSLVAFNLNDQKGAGSGYIEPSNSPIKEMGLAVFANANGVYVAGATTGIAGFGGGYASQDDGPFLVRYPLLVGAMQLANMFSGLTLPSLGQFPSSAFNGITSDGTLIWVTGSLRNTTSLTSSGGGTIAFPGTNVNSGNPGVIACYTMNGTLRWADQIKRNWNSSDPYITGKAIAIAGCDLYYTGMTSGNPTQFGNGSVSVVANTDDAFVAKASAKRAITVNKTFMVPIGSSVNTSATIVAEGATGYNWSITPVVPFGGQNTPTMNVTLSVAGTYTISCATTGGSCPGSATTKYTLVLTPGQNGGGHMMQEQDGDVISTATPMIFPNPAAESLRIFGVNTDDGAAWIELLDVLGHVCLNERLPVDGTVDLLGKGLHSGVYIVRVVREQDIVLSERLVVQQP